jgi:hypothetical protein
MKKPARRFLQQAGPSQGKPGQARLGQARPGQNRHPSAHHTTPRHATPPAKLKERARPPTWLIARPPSPHLALLLTSLLRPVIRPYFSGLYPLGARGAGSPCTTKPRGVRKWSEWSLSPPSLAACGLACGAVGSGASRGVLSHLRTQEGLRGCASGWLSG